MNKFNCIMLVDDDSSTNRFHQIIIESLQITKKIVFSKNGQQALNYLLKQEEFKTKNDDFINPDLILIDLNMPVMNGFRFLELFTKTEEFKKNNPKIIVLSTSLIPEEKEKIESNSHIYKFLNKPLTKNIILDSIVNDF